MLVASNGASSLVNSLTKLRSPPPNDIIYQILKSLFLFLFLSLSTFFPPLERSMPVQVTDYRFKRLPKRTRLWTPYNNNDIGGTIGQTRYKEHRKFPGSSSSREKLAPSRLAFMNPNGINKLLSRHEWGMGVKSIFGEGLSLLLCNRWWWESAESHAYYYSYIVYVRYARSSVESQSTWPSSHSSVREEVWQSEGDWGSPNPFLCMGSNKRKAEKELLT